MSTALKRAKQVLAQQQALVKSLELVPEQQPDLQVGATIRWRRKDQPWKSAIKVSTNENCWYVVGVDKRHDSWDDLVRIYLNVVDLEALEVATAWSSLRAEPQPEEVVVEMPIDDMTIPWILHNKITGESWRYDRISDTWKRDGK